VVGWVAALYAVYSDVPYVLHLSRVTRARAQRCQTHGTSRSLKAVGGRLRGWSAQQELWELWGRRSSGSCGRPHAGPMKRPSCRCVGNIYKEHLCTERAQEVRWHWMERNTALLRGGRCCAGWAAGGSYIRGDRLQCEARTPSTPFIIVLTLPSATHAGHCCDRAAACCGCAAGTTNTVR
jgi:hypothetical protein